MSEQKRRNTSSVILREVAESSLDPATGTQDDREETGQSEPLQIQMNWFLRAFSNERWQFISIPLLSILVSLIAISIMLGIMGSNPFNVFITFLQGAGWIMRPVYAGGYGQLSDLSNTLTAFTPMLFAALAVTIAFRGGLFNIGISGQMLISGFLASVIVGYSGLSAFVAKPLVLLIGMAAGAAVGGLIGFLKYRFNINEVVASIMLNYILQYAVSYFIKIHFLDQISRQSRVVSQASMLVLSDTKVGGVYVSIPLCFILALLVAVALQFFLKKTRLGYEIKAVGANRRAAQYSGIRVRRTILVTMMLSGALAGLAGVSYYLGYFNSIEPGALTSLGFDSIATALLGNAHPLGAIASSFLITTLDTGGTYMQSMMGVRQEIAQLVTGMILLFSACSAFFRWRIALSRQKAEMRAREAAASGGPGGCGPEVEVSVQGGDVQ
ncbi:MAG: ABC transporter permease [Coriobacteriia bacterium]|nr:ABC transporter permease [Coriobacteriia bacterium]